MVGLILFNRKLCSLLNKNVPRRIPHKGIWLLTQPRSGAREDLSWTITRTFGSRFTRPINRTLRAAAWKSIEPKPRYALCPPAALLRCPIRITARPVRSATSARRRNIGRTSFALFMSAFSPIYACMGVKDNQPRPILRDCLFYALVGEGRRARSVWRRGGSFLAYEKFNGFGKALAEKLHNKINGGRRLCSDCACTTCFPGLSSCRAASSGIPVRRG